MSISLNLGSNPTSVLYNGNNVTEVLYNGTHVWPDTPTGSCYVKAVVDGSYHDIYIRGDYQDGYTQYTSGAGKISEVITLTGTTRNIVVENTTVLPEDCHNMFSELVITSITGLDMIDTSNVVNMSGMFSRFSSRSLMSLDLSSWDVSNVTNMFALFYKAYTLTSINMSGWNTSNVNNMGNMFSWDGNITSLDLSGWDTSNVASMYAMFSQMSSLTWLDLSSFDTSKVANMQYMFSQGGLRHIYVSDSFVTTATGSQGSYRMFYWAQYLHNWIDGKADDKTYAIIDNGWNGGYFEAMDYTGMYTKVVDNVVHIRKGWADGYTKYEGSTTYPEGCITGSQAGNAALTGIVFDTTETIKLPAHSSAMFCYCSNLTGDIDLTLFDISDCTTLNEFFWGCTNISSVDISSWDTSNVSNMSAMFAMDQNLQHIYAGDDWATGAVSESNAMFIICPNLHNWNGTTDKTYAIIDDGSNNGYLERK